MRIASMMLLVLFVFHVHGVSQTTWYVPDDFPAGIEAALQDPSVVNGDTIIVKPGTYHENISFPGKAVTLKSEQGPDVTVIDGDMIDNVVSFSGSCTNDSILDGFNITNGYGIKCPWLSSPTIINNKITGNSVAGIQSGLDADPKIMNNWITGSTYGISASDGAPFISNNTISGNEDFGIYVSQHYGGSLVTIEQNVISDNGKGIHGYQCSIRVQNNHFENNYSSQYGGAIYAGDAFLTLDNNVFVNNSTGGNGGALSCGMLYLCKITNNLFVENSATGNGGALDIGFDIWDAQIFNNMILRNTAGANGGGICFASDPIADVIGNTIYGNTAAGSGGGIYASSASQVDIYNSILWNNIPDQAELLSVSHQMQYSDVEGGGPGPTNINADPLFMDPDGPDNDPNTWEDNDFHLTGVSPCIDAGDNKAPSLPEMDFEGDPRIFHGNGTGLFPVGTMSARAIVDMGADEYCHFKRKGVNQK